MQRVQCARNRGWRIEIATLGKLCICRAHDKRTGQRSGLYHHHDDNIHHSHHSHHSHHHHNCYNAANCHGHEHHWDYHNINVYGSISNNQRRGLSVLRRAANAIAMRRHFKSVGTSNHGCADPRRMHCVLRKCCRNSMLHFGQVGCNMLCLQQWRCQQDRQKTNAKFCVQLNYQH